jgi:DNA polymerase III delta prime subunit
MFENLVWEQKYRPKKIDDTILPPSTKKMLNDIIKTGNIPNMLFAGSGGIGKTTAARAIADEVDAEMLYINASLEGNIDTIRTTLTQFVSTVSMEDRRKIVLLDESDYLSNSAQPALRGFLDEFSSNASFIFTCNFPQRIIDPLISRLQVIDFKFAKTEKVDAMKQMLARAEYVLTTEGITYDKKAVATLVGKHFPDFRKTLGQLQKFSTSGEITSDILSFGDGSDIDELIGYVKDKNFSKCRQWVANSSPDASTFYRAIYDKLLPILVPASIPPVILAIAESQYRASATIDPEINTVAFLIQLMSTAQFK